MNLSEKIKKVVEKNNILLSGDYCENSADYVRKIRTCINSKVRSIVTYNITEDKELTQNGQKIRHLHDCVAELFKSLYESSESSWAYKEGCGILGCVSQHLNSKCFLKSDIRSYFESISFDVLSTFLKEDLSDLKDEESVEKLLTVVRACFYDDSLPIGFTSSPVISDYFLSKFDKKFSVFNDKVIYTRYADDFIISTRNTEDRELLESIKAAMEKDLMLEYNLSLNKKKTYFRELKQSGDSIHVLGVNIVNRGDKNSVTIGDKYIRKLSQEIQNNCTYDKNSFEWKSTVGKISFVKQCSKESFVKLEKLYFIKTGKKINF